MKRTTTIRVPDPFKEFLELERGNKRMSDGDVCLNISIEIRKLRRQARRVQNTSFL